MKLDLLGWFGEVKKQIWLKVIISLDFSSGKGFYHVVSNLKEFFSLRYIMAICARPVTDYAVSPDPSLGKTYY